MEIPSPYYRKAGLSPKEFIVGMLELGTPIELSLVGVFDEKGRGSRREIDLGWHRDGDYTPTPEGKPDYVGLYCLRIDPLKTCYTRIRYPGMAGESMVLYPGEALIWDNRLLEHSREGEIGSRLLLRMWIKERPVPAIVVPPPMYSVLAHPFSGHATGDLCSWPDPAHRFRPCHRPIHHPIHNQFLEVNDV